ncbi:uncharacterized protein [Miscanthus floridulus]|uniref:uncharacterized protein n=1 Tax=Miscanthus floridulus TaxID=154761 RepID=UPI00345AE4D9
MASNSVITILAVVVALLAVASAVLGFIAQATKLNPDEIQFHESSGVCAYPDKPAYTLGICALPLLVAAMVISTVAGGCFGGCFGCVKPHGGAASGSRRVKGVVCCVASWIAAAVAAADYVKGVRWNAATTRDAVAMGLYEYGCHYLKGAVFATAAVLTLVAAALGISSFTMILTPAPASAPAAEAEPKHDGQQSASAAAPPPPPQGQAHAQV